MLLVGLLPNSWLGLAGSAALQGIHVMMTSAVLAFWTEKLFPAMPAYSFTAALLATAAGSVVGPGMVGLLSSQFSPQTVFVGMALLPLLAGLSLHRGFVRERPIPQAYAA